MVPATEEDVEALVVLLDATFLAVVTEALTLTLAEVVVVLATALDELGLELDPSQVATDGPGIVYALPPLSGLPVLP